MSRDAGSPRDDFQALYSRVRAGEDAAWEELIAKSYERIRRVVSRKLAPPLRSLFDSTDIANDVYKSLVAHSDRYDFASYDDLIRHLSHIAKQKVIDAQRYQLRHRRNAARTQSLHMGGERIGFDIPGREPTPSQIASAGETHERIIGGVDGDERRFVELKSQEFTNEEVSVATGVSQRTVQRVLKRVYKTVIGRGDAR